MLVKKGTVFERCHAAVDPKPFYKVGGPVGSGAGVAQGAPSGSWVGTHGPCLPTEVRVYQACNYEETFPRICAALGDYALTCTSRGVLLPGWRSSVDNCSAYGPAGLVPPPTPPHRA